MRDKVNKFKVGDVVEIVSLQGTDGVGCRGDCCVGIGETGVVTEVFTDGGGDDMPYEVETNGETWLWSKNNLKLVNEEINDSQNDSKNISYKSDILLPSTDEDDFTCCLGKDIETKTTEEITSDGGSSSYYFTILPKHLIDQIVETGGIEIKDIIRYVFDNNADAFNIVKAQKRIVESLKGKGKAGITALYDMNKIRFFAEEQYNALNNKES